MTNQHHLVRLGRSSGNATADSSSDPVITNTPPLPIIDFNAMGGAAPGLPNTPDEIPAADAVVITWAEAEWAAMEHVFVGGNQEMPYSARSTSSWPGWKEFNWDMPSDPPSGWTYWGYYRLVTIGGKNVLLFKSNTHLDWPGESYLEQLIGLLIKYATPSLILSIGTAGGARLADHIGTVNVVNTGTLYNADEPESEWPVYANAWAPGWNIISGSAFTAAMLPVPTTQLDLGSLAMQFNAQYGTRYTLAELNPGNLDMGTPEPAVNNLTPSVSLLTTSTFVVANTSGNYANYACVEMDDAVIGKVCNENGVAFGFVRNISDPVQNAALPQDVQGNWGSFIYDAYGMYTSYNGALAAWAILQERYGA